MTAIGTPAACQLWRGALARAASGALWSSSAAADEVEPRDALQRFHSLVGGPVGPACSLWGQLAFNAVLIPAACVLAEAAPAQVRLAAVTLGTCPVTGRPGHLVLHRQAGRGPLAPDLVRLIEPMLGRLTDDVQAIGGLSRRMLGESAALIWAWTAREIASLDPTAASRLGRRAGSLRLPGVRASLSGTPIIDVPGQRRFCCLRRHVPGYKACLDICPLKAPSRDPSETSGTIADNARS